MSQRITLSRITLLAAWAADDATGDEAGLEALGNALAEHLRDRGALTVGCEYDRDTADVPDPADDADDAIGDALTARYLPPPAPPAPRRRLRPRCGDTQTDTDHTYRCTRPAGHLGPHAMLTHPLHPTWGER